MFPSTAGSEEECGDVCMMATCESWRGPAATWELEDLLEEEDLI